jgi:hypothetical protein
MCSSQDEGRRLVAMDMVPRLTDYLTQDMASKFLAMTWEDESQQVQEAACQALLSNGFANQLHESLLTRLDSDQDRLRIAALNRLGTVLLSPAQCLLTYTTGALGRITRRIIPKFIAAFSDKYLSVRLAACKVHM